eukprot:gnl/TRDRNA2_/TRDRNA2_116754_c0_seq1.p1 gnl/TRDRNA2_/TRDRNA2_116754_c0~~gnl/TRDRNA2_/TRDRNA2_116754_c0_seq1.p1  ORF type:complete len:366 (+),score=46.95 gnl/TRDRNA2_/TRDRNA2_116754_c0_seq1:39-1100(+)
MDGENAPPGMRCRGSFCDLHRRFRDQWKYFTEKAHGRNAMRVKWDLLERSWRMCDRPWIFWASEKWAQCKGTFVGTRQLPCGIWSTLHTLFAHAKEDETRRDEVGKTPLEPIFLVRSVRSFLLEFMPCTICKRHLLRAPFKPEGIETHRDAVIWLWNTHNYISSFVYETPESEKAFATDPAYPPQPNWPTMELCPLCIKPKHEEAARTEWIQPTKQIAPSFDAALCDDPSKCPEDPVEWDLDAVYEFLSEYYRRIIPVDEMEGLEGKYEVFDKPMKLFRRVHNPETSWRVAVWAFMLASLPLALSCSLSRPMGRRLSGSCRKTAKAEVVPSRTGELQDPDGVPCEDADQPLVF